MMLSTYKHENLISLKHFCIEGDEMILVYEYASRGSLDRYLHNASALTWIKRLKICVGAARGLRFLHDPQETQQRVLHRDSKSANILLDENWTAKVSDFGLSKYAPANQVRTYLVSNGVGTLGYCDPLYMEFGFLSKESDVYSFGVVLFEILCGRLCFEYRNHELAEILVPKWRRCYEEKRLDEIILPGLKKQMNPSSLKSFSAIANRCVKKDRGERPTMAEVVEALEFSLEQQTGITLEGPAFCVTEEFLKGKQCLEDDDHGEGETTTGLRKSWKLSENNEIDSESGPSDNQEQENSSSLFSVLGRNLSINCLLHSSRSDYGSIASLNRSFRDLVRGGELYKLRRLMGIKEHWIYFSCNPIEWEAFDPIRRRWMRLPRMHCNQWFMFSDKESVAVGTDLLVFGKEIDTHVVYKYSILTNSWSPGSKTNTPRCLFGSASLGKLAIVAGGCGPSGNILSAAELYNSETGTWITLPNMNKPKKMCSTVFMESKIYVIGGVDEENNNEMTCGEVYDFETYTWTEIPDMFPVLTQDAPATAKAPPLLAVVKNELYAAYYEEQEVRKYDKGRNLWVTLGGLPERAGSMNGWGFSFQACGNQLIVIGGPRDGGMIEVNSWAPDESPPQWNLLGRKQSGGFVYNCAVMEC